MINSWSYRFTGGIFHTRKTLPMDRQRSRHFEQSTLSKHSCSLCGKSRSKRYHNQHPIKVGQVPKPGICSRPKCAKVIGETTRSANQVTIYENHYHHYYYSTPIQDEPPPSYTTEELRLSENTLPSSRSSSSLWDPSPIPENSPPLMRLNSRARETPIYSRAAEVPGESSLHRRVELPDNRYSRRRSLRRISEESPPPVNFLKKPTGWKENRGIQGGHRNS